MIIKKKTFYVGIHYNVVTLKEDDGLYIVECNGVKYKETPSKLFAIQVFNEI